MEQPAALRPRRRWKRWLVILPLSILLGFIIYTWFVLTWTYSSGQRAGYVQKFSRKGVVFKTWEGELAMVTIPGTLPEKFFFTVRDDSVAARINATLGHRVALTYQEHVGVPSSAFGETRYFVVDVRVLQPEEWETMVPR
jgi:hypothetical protein